MDWDPLADDPTVRATVTLAEELRARAQEVERRGVTRADMDRLAALGLHGVAVPVDRGGTGTSPALARRVAELLAGADPQVWFVWFQHGPVAAMLAGSDNTALASRWVPRLCAGQAYAGVAFSHLRSPSPSVQAERVEGGWRLTGTQPWCTGWGIVDVLLAGAVTPAGEVLFALVPAVAGEGLVPGPELDLAVMAATHTVAPRFEGLFVPEDDVVLTLPYDDWLAADRVRNANVQPSTFGVALAALDATAEREPAAADALRTRVLSTRAACYRLLDDVPPGEQVDERLRLRARALLEAMEATTALVVARGGRAMGADDPGQRLQRCATFHLVHAQSPTIRAATLAALAG